MSIKDLYIKSDALTLANHIKSGEVTATELTKTAISLIEKHNPTLNFMIERSFDNALKTAESPHLKDTLFKGVPFLIKDLTNYAKGLPQHRGSKFFSNYIPKRDSDAVASYKKSGLNMLGSTIAPELGLSPVTEPKAFGICRNPWDTSKTAGGSSGGAAAAIAARIVPVASASDGGGSIRGPASCTGLFGLKTTRGRVPHGPTIGGAWHGASICHAITRSVQDSAAILDISSSTKEHLPLPKTSFLESTKTDPKPLKIALWTETFHGVPTHPDCKSATIKAAKLCENLGHHIEEARPPINGEDTLRTYMTALMGTVAGEIRIAEQRLGRKAKFNDLEVPTHLARLMGRMLRAEDMSIALDKLNNLENHLAPFFQKYDILLTPVTAKPAVPIGSMEEIGTQKILQETIARLKLTPLLKWANALDKATQKAWAFYSYTPYWNITGQPAMSVPLYQNKDNLPIGVQFTGRFGKESTLLSLAAQLERASPWQNRIPPLINP